jgi:hypothetical protein
MRVDREMLPMSAAGASRVRSQSSNRQLRLTAADDIRLLGQSGPWSARRCHAPPAAQPRPPRARSWVRCRSRRGRAATPALRQARPQEAVGRRKAPGRCGPAPGVFPKPCDGRKALRQGRPKAVVGGRNLTRSGRPHRLAGLYHQSRSPAVDHPSAPRRAGSRASSGASVSDAMMRGCPSMIGVAWSWNPVKPASSARRRSASAAKPQ